MERGRSECARGVDLGQYQVYPIKYISKPLVKRNTKRSQGKGAVMARNAAATNVFNRDGEKEKPPPNSNESDTIDADLLVQTLDRRRKDLDRQIEEFRALKEQEFRAFEYWLRHRARKSDLAKEEQRQKTLKSGLGALDSQQHRARMLVRPGVPTPPSLPLSPDEPIQDFERSGSDPKNRKSGMQRFKEALPELTRAFYGIDGYEEMVKENGKGEAREREKEFRGILTPDFLSLIASQERDDIDRSSSRFPENGLTPPKGEAPNGDRKSNIIGPFAVLSSSAEGQHPIPLTAQNLSSSCPDSHDLGTYHRRSSSTGARSDTSITSLRSSFKDPKAPRSPKRVMFDIDDMVVSPSTSPLVERLKESQGSRETEKEKRIPNVDDTEKFEIVKKKRHGNKKSGGRPKSTAETRREESRKQGPSLNSSQLRSNDGSTAQASLGGRNATFPQQQLPFVDDFEKVSFQDDMFAFDEDIDEDEGKRTAEKKDALLIDGDTECDADSHGAQAPLTGSSPHAGSLPIEIRWPGRKSHDVE